MAEHGNQRPEDEDPLFDEQQRGRGSADEEFEDADEDFDEEDEAEDEDLSVERNLISDPGCTGEIGSAGGGALEVERKRPRVHALAIFDDPQDLVDQYDRSPLATSLDG